ncbi:DUF1254 domain-containing protein [Pantoea phytobeneficialis]|uniref:DUF1254 domain-containing protein n=1 Tax=Pantoea phytobeneficialis TaxID=2052056 RepID=A0AAP9HAA2_9GAMM|nr:DUF1254 domain-containing protein [Pantoea phytobeneficialis]MDO6406476.1 DUF1254 domain-containing protein [Pantoea phytobeneficialis]QGR09573.1 hypothetical protein CTZ24_24205 [Pantoea phytobeneficialis]
MRKTTIALAITLLTTSHFNLAQTEPVTIPHPEKFEQLSQPSPDVTMPEFYVKAIAQQAYIWGYPMVNQFNRRMTITKAPYPALNGGMVPVAPMGQLSMLTDYIKPEETFVTCPNQDVAYGLGFYALENGPIVIQVPDFGDRFWVYAIYDARTDQIGNVGKPYGTKAGFYLLVGPDWKGKTPKGISGVIHSPTEMANMIPRIQMDDTPEDRAAIQASIRQVMSYPLSEFDGKMKSFEYSKIPAIGDKPDPSTGEVHWVIPDKFFDQLENVLNKVPPLPGEEAMYAQFRHLVAAGNKDPQVRKWMDEAAEQTDKTVIADFFKWKNNGVPAGNGWNRSKNNADFGVDYYNRTGTSKSNMFDNKPDETQYFYTDNDATHTQLDGKNSYTVTFAKGQIPPVKGFWSLTLYNDRHLFSPNELNRYSLGTKNKSLKYNPDGSLTLYVSRTSPGDDKKNNWLPAPEGTFSLYIRAYWGEKAILDGTWQPPRIEKTQ